MNQGKDHGDGLRHPEAEVAILQQGVVAPPQDAAARDNGGEPNDAVLPPAVGNTVRHSVDLAQAVQKQLALRGDILGRPNPDDGGREHHQCQLGKALPEGVGGVFEARQRVQARVGVRPQEGVGFDRGRNPEAQRIIATRERAPWQGGAGRVLRLAIERVSAYRWQTACGHGAVVPF